MLLTHCDPERSSPDFGEGWQEEDHQDLRRKAWANLFLLYIFVANALLFSLYPGCSCHVNLFMLKV
jgi:hypothetical protein